MSLEGFWSSVYMVTTYFAVIADIEPVQLVEPVGYRLAVPAEREVLRVVWDVLLIIIRIIIRHVVYKINT